MTPEIAIKFLRTLGSAKFDKSTLPWLTASCPAAAWRHESGVDNHPSFAILTGAHKPKCYCFSCKLRGDPEAIVGEIMLNDKSRRAACVEALHVIENEDDTLPDLFEMDEKKRGPWETVVFPEKFWNTFPKASVVPKATSFLTKVRGLTTEEIEAYDFRYDPIKDRACVSIRGFDKKLYGIRGRSLLNDAMPKYWNYRLPPDVTNPQVWHGEEWVDFDEPLLVVEGSFKLIFCRRLYKNTVSPLSATVTAAQAGRMANAFCYVHLFDPNKAGRVASQMLKQSQPKAKHVVLQLPDGEDPDSIAIKFGMGALAEIIGQALPVTY